MNAKVRCLYSCNMCGIQKQAIEVPERLPNEDIVHWVGQTVALQIQLDHAHRSPLCKSRQLDNLMIPIEGMERIGDAPKS